MSTLDGLTSSSPLRTMDTNTSPHPYPRVIFAKKSKSKSLSLPPLPRRFSTPGAASSPRRRLSTQPDHVESHSVGIHPPPILSPSKLPATDSMSYFPPFEDMGSEEAEAGPSRPPSPNRQEGIHVKNRSLGSLANFMAWATFSPTTEIPPSSRPSLSETYASTGASSPTDGERMEALTKRFTPGQGKRRTLEPMAVHEGPGGMSLLGLKTTGSMGSMAIEGVKQKRRTGSEMDVETMMRLGKEVVVGDDEERAVERMIGWTSNAHRTQRSHLSLPVPSVHLPNWRFPIPSPPITSLSPHIPLEFFQVEILNPASSSTSPSKPPSFSDLHDEELDEIEGSLLSLDFTSGSGSGPGSGAASISSMSTEQDSPSSHPTTPDRSPPPQPRDQESRLWTSTPKSAYALRKKGRFRLEGDDDEEEADEEGVYPRAERMEMIFSDKLKLRRTSSSGSKASCGSDVTIKGKQGEVTPRAGKGWKAVPF